jgi:hypothetical protein
MAKNISQYHNMGFKELENLNTRHLLSVLKSSRGKVTPIEYPEGISDEELAWNNNQDLLYDRVKTILAARPHIPTRATIVRKQEKKKLKY